MTKPSPSEHARRLLRELLADGQPHSTADCGDYVRAHMPPDVRVSRGIISGALHTLCYDDPNYTSPSYGFYQKAGGADAAGEPASVTLIKGPAERAADILDSTLRQLEQICTVNLRRITPRELREIQAVQKAADLLEETAGTLRQAAAGGAADN